MGLANPRNRAVLGLQLPNPVNFVKVLSKAIDLVQDLQVQIADDFGDLPEDAAAEFWADALAEGPPEAPYEEP